MKNIIYALNTDILCCESLYRKYYAEMDNERRKKIDRFRFDRDKRLSLGAGILLRHGMINLGISDFKIEYNKNEKPFITGCGSIYFNISHSGNYTVCAFSERPVGADIEQHRVFDEALAEFVYLPGERSEISSLSPDRNVAYTDLWTVKESLMKYLGTGLSLEPKDVFITFGETLKAQAKGYDCKSLYFTRYDDINGYSLTVCSEAEHFTDSVVFINELI